MIFRQLIVITTLNPIKPNCRGDESLFLPVDLLLQIDMIQRGKGTELFADIGK